MRKDFVVLILTHGRPDNVITYDVLRECGYTGDIRIVVDNEDARIDEYVMRYGSEVVVFDKKKVAQEIDECDNFTNSLGRKVILYARNAAFDIARNLGYTYFLELDDDYHIFLYKFTAEMKFKERRIKSLDRIFEAYVSLLENSSLTAVAFAQNGDFIGGGTGSFARNKIKRKMMNVIFCSVNKPFLFTGRINEDVSTYIVGGSRGLLFLTVGYCSIKQTDTQSASGGMTDVYMSVGTYVKSFYTVMQSPSNTKVFLLPSRHPRLHHKIRWNNTTPMILHESVKKM